MSRVSFRQRDLQAALKAAMAVGISAPTVDILPDGTLRLLTAPAPAPVPALDENDSDSFLDRWNAR